jgi:apolipoprotein N-acyltransferase
VPEKLARLTVDNRAAVDAAFAAAARTAVVVAGFETRADGKSLNEARVYGSPGVVRASYEKHHMVPGFESDLTPGTMRTTLREPSSLWGVAICKDMDFPRLSRAYSRDGVGLMLVPAWDFGADGWLHARMAVARGVEGGFSIARAAKQGLLTVSDSRGRVLAEAESHAAPFSMLEAQAPVLHESTVYARFGDWFGWANVVLLTALVTASRRTKPSAISRQPSAIS